MNAHGTSDIVWKLFEAYNASTGFDVQFNAVWERNLYDASRMGLTPEMVVLVIKDRLKGIKAGDRKPASLMPRNLFASDDMISECICEAKALLALKRKVVDAPRESVLKAWRPLHETPLPENTKHISDTTLMAALRQAAQ